MRAPTRTTASHMMRWLWLLGPPRAVRPSSAKIRRLQMRQVAIGAGPLLTLLHPNAPLAPSGTVRLGLPMVAFAGSPWDPLWVSWSRWAYRLQGKGACFVFRAHAAPRVALMFTSGPAHGEGIGRLEADPSLPRKSRRAEYRQLLDGHDFDVIATVVEDRTCGRSRIWLAQRR